MPSDALSETKACDLLARLFRARGYAIERNVPFAEYGVSFHIDGWDRQARVGFEFLSSEDEDHDDLTLREYQTLMSAQQRGELSIFVIDEVEPLSSGELRRSAEEFLDEVSAAVKARRNPARPKAAKAAAKGKPRTTPKAAAKKRPAATRVGTSVAGGKKAKPRAKKAVRRKPR
jgi:hypothetical protein